MYKYLFSFIVLLAYMQQPFAQPKTDTLLQSLLMVSNSRLVQQVLLHPETYRVQIIYTQINRDKHNNPSFQNYYYHVDSLLYFNPASTVKLPLALLSLEKLNNMHIPDVNKYTSSQFDSSYSKQAAEYHDSTSQTGLPSIAHFIKKAFLVSDNDAYNRMYEFIGQQTINRQLHAKGYEDARITRRFKRMDDNENRHTNAIRFINPDGSLIYTQPPAFNTDSFDFSHINKIGNAYYNADDSLVNGPIDFTTANNVSLRDYQQILQSAMFPNSVPATQRFNLTKDDYAFLYQYLSQFPGENNYPKYDTATYFDSYVKFFFMDSDHKTLPDGIRVFNKVGWAYGFLTDISYIADFKNNVEYMVTANIYVNSDGILNDDKYDYDNIGHPFLYQVGQLVYQYELHRVRKYKANLSNFKMLYEKRMNDARPLIKAVDN